jgi:thiol-activated cytolysin
VFLIKKTLLKLLVMKTLKQLLRLSLLLTLVLLSSHCSKDDTGAPETEIEKTNPEAESINDFFGNIPDWDNTGETALPDQIIEENFRAWDQVNIPWRCDLLEKNLVKSLEEIIAVGTNQGKMWPGALVQGNSLETGDLKLINANRAPITINSDLVINNTFREIETPNSVNVQQAIAEMQIEAGNMEEGNQAGAGQMFSEVLEASTFSQAMLSMGISGGFTEPQSQVGINASAEVSQTREAKTHTIVAKFIQKKFTVRLADDLIPNASDFFDDSTTLNDINNLETNGELGSDNIPLYVESVTYGRVLIFTLESTAVSNSEELSGALKASFADYVEGGVSLTDAQRTILENSFAKIYSAGGTEEGANAAVAGLNWSNFFVAAPVSTAVPISFKVRTLNGKKIAKLHNNISFEQRANCIEPIAYDITVTLNRATLTSGVCALCSYTSWLYKDEKILGDPLAAGTLYGVWNGPEIGGSQQIRSDRPDPNPTIDPTSFKISSGYCTLGALNPHCLVQDMLNRESRTFTWPYASLKSGNTAYSVSITEAFRTLEFNYTIRKVALYD